MWDPLEQEPGRAGIPLLHPRTALTTCEGAGLVNFMRINYLADRRFCDFRINPIQDVIFGYGKRKEHPLCDVGEFLCHDGVTCVSWHWLCDGEPDCPDDSDESLDTSSELVCFQISVHQGLCQKVFCQGQLAIDLSDKSEFLLQFSDWVVDIESPK
ncbi:hypothetical protein DUI87_04731 [Hirundo rustica rustica]|uniref:Uncharacterized protein n=1 Tax=Hirundo rustica rustica TaxID=333673 RepID=A0A3M0L0B0_HIRRU|nr:hypothetical protein DUI87_04731 [Hirundo rustica rustica]